MKSTEQLIEEHKGIVKMLNIVSNICDRLETGEKIDSDDLFSIVDFIKVFADKCHHGKEDDLFFPLLIEKGMSKNQGPLEVIMVEHTEGRSYVRGFSEGVLKYKNNDADGVKQIIENGRNYVELLKAHIVKEDNILYPMGDKIMTAEDDIKLFSQFEKVEIEKIGAGKHEEYHQLLDKLSKKYLNE